MKALVTAASFMWVVTAGISVAGAQSPAGQPARDQTTAGKPAAGSTARHDAAGADASFMQRAALSGMAEVEHGRLATRNASSAEVKAFGQRMVDDHTKANQELKALASEKKVTLPAELDSKHRALQEKLSEMKGETFDRAYMQHMVEAHQQAVKLFAAEAKSGKDTDTQGWAGKTLPILQQHLNMAREITSKRGQGAVGK